MSICKFNLFFLTALMSVLFGLPVRASQSRFFAQRTNVLNAGEEHLRNQEIRIKPVEIAQSVDNTQKAKADQLLREGTQRGKTAEFRAALQLFEQALAIYREIGDRQGAAASLGSLGLAYHLLGDYQRAIGFHQQSLVIYREIGDRRGEADSLGNLGIAYRSLGDYQRAIDFHQQSLAIKREIGDRQGEAHSLGNLGSAYYSLGDYQRAIDFDQQSLAIDREIGDRRAEAVSLGNLGNAYYSLGDYQRAIDFNQQSLAIKRKIGDRQGEANSLSNLGSAYHSLGDYQRAIDFNRQSLAIEREIGDRRGEAASLGNLGIAYRSLGDYQRAIDFHQQSLVINREIGYREGEASSLGNLGNAYYSLGDYQRAIDFHQQYLAIAREIGDRRGEAISLGSLGLAYDSLGDYQRAIDFHQQYLAIAREIGDRGGEASSLGNLGSAYDSLGDYQRAIDFHQQSLVIDREIEDRQGEANSLGNLGSAYYSLGDYQRAIDFYQQSLAIKQEIGDIAGAGRSLSNLGYALDVQGETDLAITFFKQSVNKRENIRNNIRTLSPEAQQSYKETITQSYQSLATLLLNQNRVMEAILVLDLLKVQELQDFFKDVKGNERTAQGIELFPQEKQILSTLESNPNLDLNAYLKSAPVKALAQEINQTASAQNLQLAAYRDLQTRLSSLGQNSTLFYPLILDDRLELVLFTRNAPPIHKTVPISKTELEATVANFRREITNTTSDAIQQPAQQLYQWLIEPIAAELKQNNIQTLIYAPDGQMRYVPLAALYDGKQWLVETYQINYITALSLTELDSESFQNPNILAGAFTESAGKIQINDELFEFSSIPAAKTEVESLVKTFPGTKVLLDKNFNRTGMNPDQMNRHNIVHLATHGKLVNGSPEDSFILLNNQEYITLREIKNWKLPNVGLVVLSACQTALGEQLGSGIEIIGFGYQLQQAQARASIATLWSINDSVTSDLMNEFYTQLKQGSPNPVDALRKAQIALIRGGIEAESALNKLSLGAEEITVSPEVLRLLQEAQVTDNLEIIEDKNREIITITPREREKIQSGSLGRLSHPYFWAPFILIGNGL